MTKENIVLIGMPASGKSTAGVILAKMLGMDFVDTDLVIQQREKALLRDLIEEYGVEGFMEREEKAVLSVSPVNTVIATGGSVVYSEKAMRHLSSIGTVVYLKVAEDELLRRLHDIRERGVVLKDGETFKEMFDSRSILYERYADITIEEGSAGIEATLSEMLKELR
ncbi:MAG: shikimate kinase [Lachnospiraceae bacterium]|jgi:shikimate kinase|nr:shikimate kinase [Lachnospiraceae bacterium]